MAKLLFLANGPQQRSVARLDERFADWGLHVEPSWAYHDEFPQTLTGYDGIFLSGSPHGAYEDIPFIRREHALIADAARLEIPMLGVCFGSQILASALCGRDQVFRRETCEIGYKSLPVSNAAANDPVCGALSRHVHMFVWHNDEIRAGHEDMTVIATSDACPNHIWRYRDQHIWGIQGHPEITRAQALVWFEEHRERMTRDGADVDRLKAQAVEAEQAKTLLERFAALVRGRA